MKSPEGILRLTLVDFEAAKNMQVQLIAYGTIQIEINAFRRKLNSVLKIASNYEYYKIIKK